MGAFAHRAGDVRSRTITAKLQPAVLPEPSVAVQLTVFVPLAKVEPLDGVQTTLTPGQLSVEVVAKVTTALHCPESVPITMFAGHASTGFSASLTVTEKLQLAVLAEPSVTVQLTVLVPFGKVDPAGGVQMTGFTAPQLSVAVVAKFTTAPHWPSPVWT